MESEWKLNTKFNLSLIGKRQMGICNMIFGIYLLFSLAEWRTIESIYGTDLCGSEYCELALVSLRRYR